jgi:group I intron endonuclease
MDSIHHLTPYGFIYITECLLDGKRYIGQRRYRGRWRNYLGSGHHLLRAIDKHGRSNFRRTDIYVAFDLEELNRAEIAFIAEFNAVDDLMWYNISPGGRGRTRGFTGRKHTPATIEKMRKAQRGHPVSDKARMAASANGKKSSQDPVARKKQAIAISGANHPRAKPLTWEGVTYPTVQAAADATGLPYGWLREYANNSNLEFGITTRTIWINRVQYKSIATAMVALGWTRDQVTKHISDPS